MTKPSSRRSCPDIPAGRVDETIGRSGTPCGVCERGTLAPFARIQAQDYLRCPVCAATILDPRHRLSPDAEHAHYLHHENDPDDPRYRAFLSKLAEPLMARLGGPRRGLDYGCGPGPALAAMLREAGHEMALYDPFFAPDVTPLAETYDFVTCTETAEHFHAPAEEFARLRGLVRPGGWLALMTTFQTEDERFVGWRYRQDPTHVVFYRAQTFRVLADLWGWDCEIPVKDVVLMRRPGVDRP
jgi:SAM-dependent methyltransferase